MNNQPVQPLKEGETGRLAAVSSTPEDRVEREEREEHEERVEEREEREEREEELSPYTLWLRGAPVHVKMATEAPRTTGQSAGTAMAEIRAYPRVMAGIAAAVMDDQRKERQKRK